GLDEAGVVLRQPVGAVHLEIVEQAAEDLVVARDVDAGATGVEVGLADRHLDDLVVAAGVEDRVEDLGQQQQIDDVARDLDRLGGHATSWGSSRFGRDRTAGISCRPPWDSRSTSSRSPPTRRGSPASSSTARSRAWATSTTGRSTTSSPTARSTSWRGACSPPAAAPRSMRTAAWSPSAWPRGGRATG